MAVPKPTMLQIIRGIIGAIVLDNSRDWGNSYIRTALTPHGVELDTTTASDTEANALKNVKVGVRGNLPPGLSVMVYPGPFRPYVFDSAPNGWRKPFQFHVQQYWQDHPGLALSSDIDRLTCMLYDFNEALSHLLGPGNLCGGASAWDVTGNGDYLFNPKVDDSMPALWGEDSLALRHQYVYYSDLIFTGEKYFSDPITL